MSETDDDHLYQAVGNTSNVGELATVERGPSVNLAADCAVRNVHSPSSHLPRHHYVFDFFFFAFHKANRELSLSPGARCQNPQLGLGRP